MEEENSGGHGHSSMTNDMFKIGCRFTEILENKGDLLFHTAMRMEFYTLIFHCL